MSVSLASPITLVTHWDAADQDSCVRDWNRLCERHGQTSPSRRFEWLRILRDGLYHRPLVLEAKTHGGGETIGMLPLAFMQSHLFGRFLVSLPYLNVGGVLAQDATVASLLMDRAVELADELDVNYLELRHEQRCPHPAFGDELTEKVNLQLELPPTAEELWNRFDPKVRNQIRKAEKENLAVVWGRHGLLDDFYPILSCNMRDLGTPVFARRLFASMLDHLPNEAEICVVRNRGGRAVAGAVLVHGRGVSEVPSASSLRRFNHLNCNMLMYWHLLQRSIERGQGSFDFGRSSKGSNTYRFKVQWGAEPQHVVWQYYVRRGSVGQMRPDNPKYQRRIAVWKRLPVWLTRLIGPPIVRGIP